MSLSLMGAHAFFAQFDLVLAATISKAFLYEAVSHDFKKGLSVYV
jgi:hypothetical protein